MMELQISKVNFEGNDAIKVESKRFYGPRGECYSYLILINDELVAIGKEQGNYSGGIYARKDNNSITRGLIADLPTELQEYLKSCLPHVWKWISDLPEFQWPEE